MRPLLLLALIWFQFAIITANTRAIAKEKYFATAWTDLVIAVCGFTIFKLIQESNSPADIAGYAIGAVLGGVTGIYVTRHWRH